MRNLRKQFYKILKNKLDWNLWKKSIKFGSLEKKKKLKIWKKLKPNCRKLIYKINYTKVVSKLVLTFSGRTCNTIYWNPDKAHVFCSSLSFQQAPTDVCMSIRSWVAAGFMRILACTLLQNDRYKKKRTKKMRGVFRIRKHGKCKRKGVCLLYSKNKIHGAEWEVQEEADKTNESNVRDL